jgi:hypothetical protein
MTGRLASWALLVYVALDLGNPFVPGAFGFTPERGLVWVEAMCHARPRLTVDTSEANDPVPEPRLLPTEGGHPRSTRPSRDLAAWLVGVRTGDPPARDLPPSGSDDH